jgi:hypothetical protein
MKPTPCKVWLWPQPSWPLPRHGADSVMFKVGGWWRRIAMRSVTAASENGYE